LVTHSITYLREVDLIVVLKDGKVSESGTYKELLDKKGDFADFLILHMQEQTEDKVDENGNKKIIFEKLIYLYLKLICLEIDKLLEDAPADLKEKYVRQRSESNSHSSMQRLHINNNNNNIYGI